MFTYAKLEQTPTSKKTIQKKKAEKTVLMPNLTSIPNGMKAQHESLTGFSFDVVRVHYEVGHVVQQKQDTVGTTNMMGRIPVNDGEFMEREAKNGHIVHNVTMPQSSGAVVQRVLVSLEGEKCTRKQYGESGAKETNTMNIDCLLVNLENTETTLMLEILKERVDKDDIALILDSLNALGDESNILSRLDYDLCNCLYFLNRQLDYLKEGNFIERLNRLEVNATDARPYEELTTEIEALGQKIVKMKERPATEGEQWILKKQQMTDVIEQQIIGYINLFAKFPHDRRLKAVPLRTLIAKYDNVLHGSISYITDSNETAAYSGTYLSEKKRLKPLPKLAALDEEIKKENPLSRRNEAIGNLAKTILTNLGSSKSQDKLLIYRSMDGTEALLILRYFNSKEGAAKVENEIKGSTFDIHSGVLPIGKHFGEREQAEGYVNIRHSVDNHINVLLEFTLKAGARELLFSKSLLALPPSMWESAGEGFGQCSEDEGIKAGYIGLKKETVNQGEKTYSLGVAQGNDSRLILQLLIESVRVIRMIS